MISSKNIHRQSTGAEKKESHEHLLNEVSLEIEKEKPVPGREMDNSRKAQQEAVSQIAQAQENSPVKPGESSEILPSSVEIVQKTLSSNKSTYESMPASDQQIRRPETDFPGQWNAQQGETGPAAPAESSSVPGDMIRKTAHELSASEASPIGSYSSQGTEPEYSTLFSDKAFRNEEALPSGSHRQIHESMPASDQQIRRPEADSPGQWNAQQGETGPASAGVADIPSVPRKSPHEPMLFADKKSKNIEVLPPKNESSHEHMLASDLQIGQPKTKLLDQQVPNFKLKKKATAFPSRFSPVISDIRPIVNGSLANKKNLPASKVLKNLQKNIHSKQSKNRTVNEIRKNIAIKSL